MMLGPETKMWSKRHSRQRVAHADNLFAARFQGRAFSFDVTVNDAPPPCRSTA
jgi:hypothetical protein